MQYGEVEVYFQTEDFDGLIERCQPVFAEVLELSARVKEEVTIDTPEAIKEIMMKMSGCYGELKVIHIAADTTKKREELVFYNNKKMAVEAEGKKFVDGATKMEASNHAMNYRRIRNAVGAYLDICDKTISVCQSVLKYALEEARINKG